MKKLEFYDKMIMFGTSLIIIGMIGMFITVLFFMSKKDDENYKKCLENHSVKYCEKNILGVY